ncbi:MULTISPECIES: alpha/beta hydrolase [Myroides]|uniref:Alpha/beta fold hydrolase n=1 Tax=Myroides albus TaxID=2562892 RepID=A0A6I3LEU8_9FLAO|nr:MULTISPECIES: alpha/beta hydrolase [Myroides]MTG97989.1 alpha/beta fold hydrolase [Myroides albus]MVX34862.1 alpha/beta fold hydrolase [Myroides sp. LoEW2-1]UVD80280.1 alpha/beta hydrolase [Myroides albus]
METQKQKQSLEIPRGIILTAKTLQFFSIKLATRFAQNLFITPIKFKPPKREKEMLDKSISSVITVKALKKDICVYQYGTNKQADKKALLIHGWNGRGTQLVTIANMLMRQGYDIVSFDAPGHGKSPKTKTNLTEFMASAFEVEQQFGPFDLVVGHSLGGMTTINCLKDGLKAKKAVVIGSGDVVEDVIDEFVQQIELKPIISTKIKERFESQFKQSMQSYCVHLAAEKVNIPLLIIHDEDDADVHYKAAYQIKKHSPNSELMITKELGHRKILGDKKVIERILQFVQKES